MALTTLEIADAWKEHRLLILAKLTIDSLSPLMRSVLCIVVQNTPPGLTSMEVRAIADREANHTTTILIRLHEVGLIERAPVVTSAGLHYRWWANQQVQEVFRSGGKTSNLRTVS